MLSIVFFFFWSETLWQHISWDIDTREFLDSFAIIRLILKKVSYIKEQSGSEDQHLWNEAVLFQPFCYVTVLRFCLKHTQWNRFRIRLRYTVPLYDADIPFKLPRRQCGAKNIIICHVSTKLVPVPLVKILFKQPQWKRSIELGGDTVPL